MPRSLRSVAIYVIIATAITFPFAWYLVAQTKVDLKHDATLLTPPRKQQKQEEQQNQEENQEEQQEEQQEQQLKLPAFKPRTVQPRRVQPATNKTRECKNTIVPKTYWISRSDKDNNKHVEPYLQKKGWTFHPMDDSIALVWARGGASKKRAYQFNINKLGPGYKKPPAPCFKDRILTFDVPGLSALTNKALLPQTIKTHATRSDFLPQTFRMTDANEVRLFVQELSCNEDDVNAKTWILKNAKASRARGISIMKDPREIAQYFGAGGDTCLSEANDDVIQKISRQYPSTVAQEYIANPLLFEGRKFHIRAFVLLANIDPLLVFYCNSFVLISAEEYDTSTLDFSKHITNARVSKAITQNKKTRVSIDMLQEYLTQSNPEEFPDNWVSDTLLSQIKGIITESFKAYESVPKPTRYARRFTLLGADMITTEDGKVYLCEFQNGPQHAYQHYDDWAAALAKNLAEESLDIAFEVKERVQNGTDFKNMSSVENFEVLIDSS